MQVRGIFGEGEIITPPRLDAAALLITGFVVCPLALQPVLVDDIRAQEIYRAAYELAWDALRPSWYLQLYQAGLN
jgi:hypothetical protein